MPLKIWLKSPVLTTKPSGSRGHSEGWILEGDGYIHGDESSEVLSRRRHAEASEKATSHLTSSCPVLQEKLSLIHAVSCLSLHLVCDDSIIIKSPRIDYGGSHNYRCLKYAKLEYWKIECPPSWGAHTELIRSLPGEHVCLSQSHFWRIPKCSQQMAIGDHIWTEGQPGFQ